MTPEQCICGYGSRGERMETNPHCDIHGAEQEPSEQRWTFPLCPNGHISKPNYPCFQCGQLVEDTIVMPVADHEQAVKELREALAWYALETEHDDCCNDYGSRARSALARTGGQDG